MQLMNIRVISMIATIAVIVAIGSGLMFFGGDERGAVSKNVSEPVDSSKAEATSSEVARSEKQAEQPSATGASSSKIENDGLEEISIYDLPTLTRYDEARKRGDVIQIIRGEPGRSVSPALSAKEQQLINGSHDFVSRLFAKCEGNLFVMRNDVGITELKRESDDWETYVYADFTKEAPTELQVLNNEDITKVTVDYRAVGYRFVRVHSSYDANTGKMHEAVDSKWIESRNSSIGLFRTDLQIRKEDGKIASVAGGITILQGSSPYLASYAVPKAVNPMATEVMEAPLYSGYIGDLQAVLTTADQLPQGRISCDTARNPIAAIKAILTDRAGWSDEARKKFFAGGTALDLFLPDAQAAFNHYDKQGWNVVTDLPQGVYGYQMDYNDAISAQKGAFREKNMPEIERVRGLFGG